MAKLKRDDGVELYYEVHGDGPKTILLTHGYFLEEDAQERRVMKPYPPLGLLYVSSHLKAKGFDVAVFDSTFRSFAALVALLDRERPKVVGIYCNLMTKRNVKVTIGGCGG